MNVMAIDHEDSPERDTMPEGSGEGVVIADLDFTRIDKRQQLMDSRGES